MATALMPNFHDFDVGLHDVFDRGFLEHVDRFADCARKERLDSGHHVQMSAPGDGAAASGRRQRAIEDRQIFRFEPGRTLDLAMAVNVGNDLRCFLRRAAEVHPTLRARYC